MNRLEQFICPQIYIFFKFQQVALNIYSLKKKDFMKKKIVFAEKFEIGNLTHLIHLIRLNDFIDLIRFK